MTIKERFAKYTTEELAAAMKRLEAKIDESEKLMKHFKEERNVEFFKIAEERCNETFNIYMDVRCAYEARIADGLETMRQVVL